MATTKRKIKYEEKFIIFNKKYLNKMPLGLQNRFAKLLSEMSQFIPDNKYYVCNQNEPYAKYIINLILEGEKLKNNQKELNTTSFDSIDNQRHLLNTVIQNPTTLKML